MDTLAPSDLIRLQAAQEHLRAGNPAGAQASIHEITPEAFNHPELLEIRWEIASQTQQWEAALELARSLRTAIPENRFGWMYEAASLMELNRAQEAFDLLSIAEKLFPEEPGIPYNLTCCACRLKKRPEASRWLARAIEVGGRAEVKLMAFDDPDLAPLLNEICAL